jgi:outer membrane protein
MQKIIKKMSCSVKFILTFILITNSTLAQDSALKSTSDYSLDRCFNLTLEQSENLKIRDEELNIAKADYQAALSTIYPQISYDINQTIRDNVNFGRIINNSRPGIDDPGNPVGGVGGLLGKTQVAGTVAVSQALFTGFREYLLSDAANKEIDKIKLENIRARELLYKDVADLFYQISFTEKEMKIVEQAKTTLLNRVKELNEFIKLGKSRSSEVIAARSDIAELNANYEQLKGLVLASKELLSFLTGIEAEQIKLRDQETVRIVKDLNYYLQRSKERSDTKASEILIQAEELRLKAAQRERWPQLGLSANAFTFDDPDRNREWEVLLRLSLPIFDGGRISARTESAEARLRSASLRAKQTLRLVERDIRVAYANLNSRKMQIAALEELKLTANKNYKLQKEDYNNGVVTNLEVLQALRQMQETDRQLLQIQGLYIRNIIDLKVAAGEVLK